jgi:hypothetical protein
MHSFDRRTAAAEHAELVALRASLLDLRSFMIERNKTDNPEQRTVNPVDVMNRLDEAHRAATSAHFAAFDEAVA